MYEDIARSAVLQDWRALKHVRTPCKGYAGILRAALSQDARALQFADSRFKGCLESCCFAVQKNGLALEFVKVETNRLLNLAHRARDGWNSALAATKRLEEASKSEAVEFDRVRTWKYCGQKLMRLALKATIQPERTAKSLVAGVKRVDTALHYEKGYWGIAFAAVQQNGRAMQFVPKDIAGYRELAFAAVKQDAGAFDLLEEALQEDWEIVLAAVKGDGRRFEQLSESLRGDWEIAIAAIRKNWRAFAFVSDALKRNTTMAFLAVRENWQALKHVPYEIPNYRTLACIAIEQNPRARGLVHRAFHQDWRFVFFATFQSLRAGARTFTYKVFGTIASGMRQALRMGTASA